MQNTHIYLSEGN